MTKLIGYVVVFVLGFAVCAIIYNKMPPRGQFSSEVMAPQALSPTSNNSSAKAGPGTAIYAVERLEPSVVNIDITGNPEPAPSESNPFGLPLPMFGAPSGEITPMGQASGVIISSDGYILTNNHVAGDARLLRVTLHDGRRFSAKVVGLDPRSDLAVIKVDGTNLPAATIANSSDIKVGQSVIAIGNPLGIGATVTHGIISAIRSPFEIKGQQYPEIIQTDAPINPGNSGGALADLDGNVIGINSAIASTNGGSIGIGFAIPIDMAMRHAEELIKTHKVIYPWLGVLYSRQPLDKPLPVQGVPLWQVVPGSPAAKAGLQAGDVVTQINGHKLDEPGKVFYFVMQHKPGDKITITFWRNGQTKTVDVILAQMPDAIAKSQPNMGQEQPPVPSGP